MSKIITTLFAIFSSITLTAQLTGDSLSPDMQKIAKPESERHFIKFRDDVTINAEKLFSDHKLAFGLNDDDAMVVFKSETDDLGFTHKRYQQYYKGIKVDRAVYIVHTNNKGVTYAANGKIASSININITPALSPAQAIDFALQKVNAKEYKWQSDFWQNEIRKRKDDPSATYYPNAELVIVDIESNPGQHALAYSIVVETSSPNFSQCVFVDASTGRILRTDVLQWD